MEIIAETVETVIISATKAEVREILTAVLGKRPEKVEVGQKIPAIDYASTIRKIQSLSTNSQYMYMVEYFEKFKTIMEGLQETVKDAANLEE